MTRTTRVDSVPRASLPEFLRSPAVGAVIAEALEGVDAHSEAHTGAVTDMIAGAASEIRTFHGTPTPSDTRTARERQEDERETAAAHDVHGTHS